MPTLRWPLPVRSVWPCSRRRPPWGGIEMTSRTSRTAMLMAAALMVSCGGGDDTPPARNIGHQTGDIASDTRVLREASAAVNEVLRNQDDCAAARPAIEAATAELDEADKSVRTQAGKVSLQSLRTQVSNVANICP